MNTLKRSNKAIEIAQILLWVMICTLPPMFTFLSEHNWEHTLEALLVGFKLQSPIAAIYFINFYLIVPYFLFKRRSFRQYVIANLSLLTVVNLWFYFPPSKLSPEWQSVLWTIIIASFLFQLFVVAFATGMRYIIRWNEMELKRQAESQKNAEAELVWLRNQLNPHFLFNTRQAESQKNAEAELVWLRNQLNPHFLFNTLNNISSLIQVDADTAQESIGQLSDLLRYALYESSQKEVPLASEVAFMRDYIDLMRLRCNKMAKIEVELPDPAPNVMVIPLLFISPIENAFKHGVNNRRPSFVHIRLAWDEGRIVFQIENSRHPKAETDRVGSGIGIENLRRRLELAYPGRHAYRQSQTDTTYQVTITIKP